MPISPLNSSASGKTAASPTSAGSCSQKTSSCTCSQKKFSHSVLLRFLLPTVALLLLLITAIRIFPLPDFLRSEESQFLDFTEQVFRSEMSGNTLNLHYTIANPETYDLNDLPVRLGNASLKARQQSAAVLENYKTTLENFQYEELSTESQLTWDIFHNYLETELSAASLLLYDEPLSSSLGVQAQLPILLAEYTFRTKGDIEDYLCLLTQIPDYFSSILAFERDKASVGLFMSSDSALEVIRQCKEFIEDSENNYLIEIFNEKIDCIQNLTADEKTAYKTRNKSILEGYVIPAYETLISGIGALEGSGVNEQGLYWLPEGKAYYEYLVKSSVGDERPIEEIEEAVKTQMVEDFTAMQELAKQIAGNSGLSDTATQAETSGSPDTATQTETPDNSGNATAQADTLNNSGNTAAQMSNSSTSNDTAAQTENSASSDFATIQPGNTNTSSDTSRKPEVMLEELRQKINTDFPLLPNVSYTVKYVHASLQEYLSPAFYLTPAIDDYQNNVIYINPSSNYDDLELFTTLAHEGYPGHLYQTVYFSAQSPDLLRCILDVGGYTEGWATYVEMYAYSLWEEDPTTAALYQRNRSFTLGLASLLDIGIHYHGYSLAEVTNFLSQLGFGSDTAQSLYQSILQSPANYLKYYVGYLNFLDLRTQAQTLMQENFSLKEFHKFILETGPAPFAILEERMQERFS